MKKEHFKTAVPVCITAMLVMVTLKSSIASKLPQTSDVKFIDIFLYFGLLLHFLILVLLVLIEHLPDKKTNVVFVDDKSTEDIGIGSNRNTKQALVAFGRKVLPLCVLIFIFGYSLTAFILYNQESNL